MSLHDILQTERVLRDEERDTFLLVSIQAYILSNVDMRVENPKLVMYRRYSISLQRDTDISQL